MSKIQALQKDALTQGASSPGLTRHVAFKGDGVQVVRSRVEPMNATMKAVVYTQYGSPDVL